MEKWTDIHSGDIFEGPCNPKSGNIYQCVEVNYEEGFIDAIALFDGSKGHLIWYSSSPKKISKDNADKFIEIFKKDGERGVMLQQGYDESFVDEFIKNWRD